MAESDQTNLVCGVPRESLQALSDTTKVLLRLVEQIQAKTHSCRPIPEDSIQLYNMLETVTESPEPANEEEQEPTPVSPKASDGDLNALQLLGVNTKHLEGIEIQNEDDDCSIYKRLTRKCTCLNRKEFNDFTIHFNEDIKSCTSSFGEIIKNIRILKKFLYMGDGYSKNSLLFLNEGLEKSVHSEKVDIIQACSHADICNVFESETIVVACIWTLRRDKGLNNDTIQILTAKFLHNLAQVEEGRRYLNFSTRISNEINTVLHKNKKFSALSVVTEEILNTVKALLSPPVSQHLNVTYYWKAEEGMGFRTINSLELYSDLLTSEEILTHLDWLDTFSQNDKGRTELTQYIPNMLRVFKYLLIRYNDGEINTYVTNILNNIIGKRFPGHNGALQPVSPPFEVANVSTEPILMKQEVIQVPSVKNVKKKVQRFKRKEK